MDGKKDLAQKHADLVRQLRELSRMLHEDVRGIDPSAVALLDQRIARLEHTISQEAKWLSPFLSDR